MNKLTLNRLEIKGLVELYDIGRLVKYKEIITSGNNSFLISTTKNKYILRLCGDNYRRRSKAEIQGELNLIDRLLRNNFPVIDYERMKNKQKVVVINDYNGYLRKYIKAGQIKNNPTKRQLLTVGKILGRYHNIIQGYQAGKLRQNINYGLKETKNYFKEEKNVILNGSFKDKEKFVENFGKEIDNIKLLPNLPKGMIHEDLGKRHVFWQDNRIKAIIDFDRSYYGYLILDLGQAMRGWCFNDNWQKWNKQSAKYFLEGYQSRRTLTVRERKYLVAAIKFAILERSLSFATGYIYSNEPDEADQQFALDSLFKQLPQVEI